jgi:hypothetical protein
MFNIFSKPPPPPPPKKWFQQPALILTFVAMFVLGPVGIIWNGLTEEMKTMKIEDKENKGAIIQNQLAIKELLTRQQILLQPKAIKLREVQPSVVESKKAVPPDYFNSYMKLSKESQAAYKKYLEKLGYDTEALP